MLKTKPFTLEIFEDEVILYYRVKRKLVKFSQPSNSYSVLYLAEWDNYKIGYTISGNFIVSHLGCKGVDKSLIIADDLMWSKFNARRTK